MEHIVSNVVPQTRRERLHGRDYLVAPLSLIVPGVLNGSQGPLYYPPEEVSRDPFAWNHIPLVVNHPTRNGQPVSARSPEVLEKQGVGFVFKAAFNGKLTAEGWFDVEATRRVDNRVLVSLEKGQPMELSTGLGTENVPAANDANHNGKLYTHIARNYRPDHLAILPDGKGACSLEDGCGVLVNEDAESLLSELADLIGVNVLGQVRSKVTGFFKRKNAGTGAGEVHEAAQTGAMTLSEEDRARGASVLPGIRPPWATDEAKWERAKTAADKGGHAAELYGAVVAHIYRKLGGVIENAAPVTNQETGDSDMDRAKTIAFLVTNCDCWKGKEKVLENQEAFSDADLAKLKANLEKAKNEEVVANAARAGYKTLFGATDAQLTANAMPAFIQEKIDAKKEGEEEDEEEEEGKKKPTENKKVKPAKQPTANEWLATAPPEIKSAVQNAMAIEKAERTKLVERLTANLQGDAKTKLTTRLQGKPLDELRDLAELLPTANTQEPDLISVPSFLGAGWAGGPVGNGEPELLDLPVMNWATDK